MKKRTKRILAMLLASAMILQQGSTVGVLATETEPASETVAETQSETTAETQAPETTAETNAPEIQAIEAALGTTQTDTPAATQTESDAAQTQQSETVAAMQTEQSETVAETISSTQQSETVSQETTEAPAQTEEKTEAPTETVTEKEEIGSNSGVMTMGLDNAPMLIREGTVSLTEVADVTVSAKGNVDSAQRNGKFDFYAEFSIKEGKLDEAKNALEWEYDFSDFLEKYPFISLLDQAQGEISYGQKTLGTYEIKDGKIILKADISAFESNVTGGFSFSVQFDKKKLGVEKQTEFEFPGGSKVVVKYEELKHETSKAAHIGETWVWNGNSGEIIVQAAEDGSYTLYYEVEFTPGVDLDSLVLHDTLGGEQTFDKTNVTVSQADDWTEKTVSQDKITEQGKSLSVDVSDYVKNAEGKIPADKKIKLKYSTKVPESALGQQLSNSAHWTWNGDNNTENKETKVTLKKEYVVKKEVSSSTDTAGNMVYTYTITVGDGSYNLAGHTITDIISNNQKLKGNIQISPSIDGVTITPNEIKDTASDNDATLFKFTFPSDKGELKGPYTITYSTTTEGVDLDGSHNIKNRVTDEDDKGKGEDKSEDQKHDFGVGEDASLDKEFSEWNEDNKSVTWTIDVTITDGSELPLHNVEVVESGMQYTTDPKESQDKKVDMTIDWDTIEVWTTNEPRTKLAKDTDYTIDEAGKKIKFATLSKNVQIVLVTRSNVDFTKEDFFKVYNTATLFVNGVQKNSDSADQKRQANMYVMQKNGEYDTASGLFTWTVKINPTRETFAEDLFVYFEDLLPEGMIFAGYDGRPGIISATYNNWGDGARVDIPVEVELVGSRYKIKKVQIVGTGHGGAWEGKLSGNEYTIVYQTKLSDSERLSGTSKKYTNTAYLVNEEGEVLQDVTGDVDFEYKAVDKSAADELQQNDQIQYKVVVNPAEQDLYPGSDFITLSDTIQEGVELMSDKVTVKDFAGNDVPFTKGYRDRTLTLRLPDSKALIVTYYVQVQDLGKATFTNTVVLKGVATYTDTVEKEYDVKEHGAWVKGDSNEIYLNKVDEDDMDTVLPGVEFGLYAVTVDAQGKISGDSLVGTYISDSQGGVKLKGLTANSLYYWKETKALDEYQISDTKNYFVMFNKALKSDGHTEDSDITKQNEERAVEFAEKVQSANAGIKVHVVKEWYSWIVSNKKVNVTPAKESLKIAKAVVGASAPTTIPSIFQFTVAAVDPTTAPLPEQPTVTNTAGKVQFGEMTFDAEGTYKYQITETGYAAGADTLGWLPLSRDVIYAVVKVSESGNALSAETTYYTDEACTETSKTTSPTIKNTFTKPASTTAPLEIKKVVSGEGAPSTIPNSFEFTVAAIDPTTAPLPNPSTVKNEAGIVRFNSITFDDKGTYKYKITETGFVEGTDTTVWKKSAETVYAKVIVERETNQNKLKAEVSYYNDEACTDPLTDPTITNIYTKPGSTSAELAVKKATTGTGAPTGSAIPGIFTFTVTSETKEAPLPTPATKINDGENVNFAPIIYDADDYAANADHAFIYEISENAVPSTAKEWRAPENVAVYAKVVLTKNPATNALSSEVSYYSDADCTIPVKTPTITNTYTQPTGSLSVSKVVVGNEPTEVGNTQGVSYEVTVTALDNTVSLTPADVNVTVTVNGMSRNFTKADKSITFNIKKDEEALIAGLPLGQYKVEEKIEGESFTATYTVGENAGLADASVQLTTENKDAKVVITNVYKETQKKASGTLNLNLTKAMKNPAFEKDLSKFAFTLKQVSPESKLELKENADTKGNATFELFYDEEDAGGTFVYEIRETPGEDATVIYDPTVYTVTVKVAEEADENDILAVEVTSVKKTSGETTTDLGAKGSVTFVNDTTTVKVDKVDEAGHKLKDAKLQITVKDQATGEPVDSWATDDKTHEITGKLEVGKTYVLEETEAPTGYVVAAPVEFTIDKDGNVVVGEEKVADNLLTMIDAAIRLEVDKKATGTGEELDGAVLELLDKDGKVLDSWTSKKGQTHDFGSKLKAGESYTLRETVAPDGYTCVTDMKFTVAEDGTVTGLDSIKTTDTSGNTVYVVEDTLNKVSIEKVDESGAALSGAKLVVKDADSAVVDSWTTDGKAHEITGLAKGKYTLSEVEAPEGYQVSKDVPFEITGTEMVGSVLSLTMTDTKIPDSNKYSLTVTKHLRLDGVPSELAAKDVTYYVALFSDAEKTQRVSNVEKIEFHNETSSTVTFDKLAEGTYYVGETDENGTLLVSKIVNDEIIFYPEYSGDGKVELEGRDTDKVADFTNVYMKLTNDFYLSGQITVTKKILVNGEEGTSDETYYARLFTDPELTDPLDEILALDLAGNSSASVTVTNLPIGETLDSTRSYYVAETDENGNVLDPDAVTEFEISIDKSEIVLSANNSAQEVVITNSFTEEETETETETEVPKKAAPKTGDDTDFMRYLLLMALSAGICAVAFEEKRRRNRARK